MTVAVGDRRDALRLARRGAPVAFALASEGQPLATCGLAITASSHDLDAAYALIDHLLEPETQAEIALAADDLVANRDAAKLVRARRRRARRPRPPRAAGPTGGARVVARAPRLDPGLVRGEEGARLMSVTRAAVSGSRGAKQPETGR